MHNNFYRERIQGAPGQQGQNRRIIAGPKSNQGTGTFKADYFGLPPRSDERRKLVKDIDPLSRISIFPIIQPLQLTFTSANKFREKLIENLANWRILARASVISGSTDQTFTLRFDDIGGFMSAVKIGNANIATTDAIYQFRSEPIFLCKTILTKETKMKHFSAFSEPTADEKFHAKYNRALNIQPALNRINEYNQQMSEIAEHNIWREDRGEQPMEEIPLPTDEVAFSIQRNFHGESGCLSAWLNTLIQHDHFLKEFENEREELKRRVKRDKDKLAPLGATMCLGTSKLRYEETRDQLERHDKEQSEQEELPDLDKYRESSSASSRNQSRSYDQEPPPRTQSKNNITPTIEKTPKKSSTPSNNQPVPEELHFGGLSIISGGPIISDPFTTPNRRVVAAKPSSRKRTRRVDELKSQTKNQRLNNGSPLKLNFKGYDDTDSDVPEEGEENEIEPQGLNNPIIETEEIEESEENKDEEKAEEMELDEAEEEKSSETTQVEITSTEKKAPENQPEEPAEEEREKNEAVGTQPEEIELAEKTAQNEGQMSTNKVLSDSISDS